MTTRFRPCIDLHNGQVKQIVGGSLRDLNTTDTTTAHENFVSDHSAAWFANRYRADNCQGGHVIKLGPGNDAAAEEALAAWPGGLQIGGGITIDNAEHWLDAGASHVIVTSWLFTDGRLNWQRLNDLAQRIGPERLIVDLSCRRVENHDHANNQQPTWHVATDRWQTVTETCIDATTLERLHGHCAEVLIHAADVEGLQGGIDEDLVRLLGDICPLPATYAGGARSLDDLRLVNELSHGRVDLTIGSALDLFGGTGVQYASCLAWNAAAGQ